MAPSPMPKAGYSLRGTIFQNPESFLGNPRDEVTFVVDDGDVQVYRIDITSKAWTFGYGAFFLSELGRYLGLLGFWSRGLTIFVCAAAGFRDGFGALFVWTALAKSRRKSGRHSQSQTDMQAVS